MITKNVIVLVLLLGNMTSLSAQYFGSPDCHWIYDRSGRDAFTEVVFDSDTVINNQVYNEFDIRVHTARVIDTVVGSIMSIYLNNTNGLVTMSYDAIKIDTLIDYNAVPGDTWTIYHDLLPDCYLVTVIDTFTVTFAGRSYSALSYNHFRKNSSPTTFIDTIYEHWGFRHDFILPYDWYNGLAGNNVGGGLLCFTNDAVGTIEVGLSPDVWLVEPFPYECDEMPPLVDVDEPSYITYSLFPNPVSDWLTVSGRGFGSSYAVHSVSGEQRLRGELSFDGRVGVTGLPVGIYFLEIDGVVQKFVKME